MEHWAIWESTRRGKAIGEKTEIETIPPSSFSVSVSNLCLASVSYLYFSLLQAWVVVELCHVSRRLHLCVDTESE